MSINQTENTLHSKQQIEGKPNLWRDRLKMLRNNKNLQDFYSSLAVKKGVNIVLTGAGTSAYIGEITEHLFIPNNKITSRAIPTTTLVTHFTRYIHTTEPLLLISFARSGTRPERIAAVDIAESLCSDVYHILITFNA